MKRIAGHDFEDVRPGARCQREDCKGVQSLIELLALRGVLRIGDPLTAHSGGLEQYEIDQINTAGDELDKQFTAVFGF